MHIRSVKSSHKNNKYLIINNLTKIISCRKIIYRDKSAKSRMNFYFCG
jgi:hypothetical protein